MPRGYHGSVALDVHRDVETVAAEWRQLVDRVGAAPWMRPEWIAAWIAAFGTGPPPRSWRLPPGFGGAMHLEVWILREAEQPVALVPLVRLRGALFSPTNWDTPAFAPLAEDAKAADNLARVLFGAGAHRLELRFLPDEFPLPDLHARARDAGYRTTSRVLMRSPYLEIEGSWEDYEAGLSRNHRGDVRRRRRRLEEQGELAIDVHDGRERLDELLDEAVRIEASGWKRRAGSALAVSPRRERFYRLVASWAAREGWLRLAFLRLDGAALAFHLNLEADGVLYHLKGGYDEAYERLGAGKVLQHAMLARAFELGLRRFEFLGGAERYKLAWTSTVHVRWMLQAFAPTPVGLAEWALYRYGRPLAKRLSRGPSARAQRRASRPSASSTAQPLERVRVHARLRVLLVLLVLQYERPVDRLGVARRVHAQKPLERRATKSPKVEPIGVPAHADRRVVGALAARMAVQRFGELLALRLVEQRACLVLARDVGGARAVQRVAALPEPLRVMQRAEQPHDLEVRGALAPR
jgi:CelD/BcsL family acetyltransferase involved in cellulose biosynthesis